MQAVSSVVHSGSTSAIKNVAQKIGPKTIKVTEQVVKEAVKGAPLKTQQPSVSLPKIQRYVDRLATGEILPAIKVDKGIIIDGNHRYIAGRVVGREIEQLSWVGGRVNDAIDLVKLFIDPTDW